MSDRTPRRYRYLSRVLILVAAIGAFLASGAFFVWKRWPFLLRPEAKPLESPPAAVARAPSDDDAFHPPIVRPAAVDPGTMPRGEIAGVVRAAKPGGIQDATVCLVYQADPRPISGLPSGAVCVPVASDGHYVVNDVVPTVRWTLSASSSASGPVRADGDPPPLAPGEARAGVDIKLHADGVPFVVKVRGPDGAPVAGAEVRAWHGHAVTAPRTTDGSGEAALVVNPGSVRISAKSPGMAWASAERQGTDGGITVHVLPGSTLSGRVKGPGDEVPPVGTLVLAGERFTPQLRYARTLAGGAFRFEGLPPGNYGVRAGTLGRSGSAEPSVSVPFAGSVGDVVVALRPQFLLTGSLTVEGKRCRHGSVVLFQDAERGPNRQTITAHVMDGEVSPTTLPGGEYRVTLECKGFDRNDGGRLTVREGDPASHDWVMSAHGDGRMLRVRVVDAAGARVSDADVEVKPPPFFWQNAEPEGGDYYCRLQHNWTGPTVVYARRGDQWAGTASLDVTRDRDDFDVRVTLKPALAFEGAVVDAGGHSVPHARVVARGGVGEWGTSTTARDDGTFRMGGLVPGKYQVRGVAWHEHGGRGAPASIPVDVPANTGVTVVVPARDQIVEGVVHDGSGKPIAGALLEARSGDNCDPFEGFAGLTAPPGRSDAEGRFRFPSMESGRLTVHAYRLGGGDGSLENIRTGASNVVVTIHTKARLSGWLEGETIGAGFTIESRRGHVVALQRFDGGGNFTLEGLEPGEQLILVSQPGGAVGAAYVTLRDGEVRTGLVIKMVRSSTIRGRVVSLETGAPLAGYRVGISHLAPGGATVARDDAEASEDGRFELTGTAGRAHLSVNRPGEIVFAFPSVEINADGEVNLGSIPISTAPQDRKTTLGVQTDDDDLTRREPSPLRIRSVDETASAAGVVIGDVVVNVDGHDVRGARRYLFEALTHVPQGRTVTLTLERGVKVPLVARAR